MGPHHSTVTSSDTTGAISSYIQKLSANSISYADANNTLIIDGNDNVVNNVTQTITAKVNQSILDTDVQSISDSSSLANSVSQSLNDNTVAMTQWLDNSQETVNSTINSNVSNSVTESTIMDAVSSIDSTNLLLIEGSANVVSNIVQTSQTDAIQSRLLKSNSVNTAVNNITAATNQSSVYTSNNPLAPFTDAAKAMFADVAIAVVVVVIAVACFVFLVLLLRHIKKKRAARQAEMAAEMRSQPGMNYQAH